MNSMEYITVGPTPCEEDCAQVGTDDYRSNAKIEMKAYIDQIYRQFPFIEENDIWVREMWFNHDFGRYGEVAIFYNENNQKAVEYAYFIDANIPMTWDDEALKYLEENKKKG